YTTAVTKAKVRSGHAALCSSRVPIPSVTYLNTATLVNCDLEVSRLYKVYVYIEDDLMQVPADGKLHLPALELVTNSRYLSNFFTVYPYFNQLTLTADVSPTVVRFNYAANNTGRIYAGLLLEDSATDQKCGSYDLEPVGFKQDVPPFLCGAYGKEVRVATGQFVIDQAVENIPISTVELENCNLVGGKSYNLYVYVEDYNPVTNYFAGAMSDAVEINIPVSNSFGQADIVDDTTAISAGGVTTDGLTFAVTISNKGFGWAEIFESANIQTIDIAEMKSGRFAVGSSSCRVSGTAYNSSFELTENGTSVLKTTDPENGVYNWTLSGCSLTRKQPYSYYLYVEDERQKSDGTLLGPFALPLRDYSNYFRADIEYYGKPHLRGTPTRDRFALGFTPEFNGKIWCLVVDDASTIPSYLAFVNQTQAKTSAEVAKGVKVTSFTSDAGLILARVDNVEVKAGVLQEVELLGSFELSKNYTAFFYLEDENGLNDGSLHRLPAITIPAKIDSINFFHTFPYLCNTPTTDGIEFKFAANQTGYLWATLFGSEHLHHGITDAKSVKYRSGNVQPMLECFLSAVPITASTGDTTASMTTLNFTSCSLYAGKEYNVLVYIESEELELDANGTAVANSFLQLDSDGTPGNGTLAPMFNFKVPISNNLTAYQLSTIPTYTKLTGSEFDVSVTAEKTGRVWVAVFPISVFIAYFPMGMGTLSSDGVVDTSSGMHSSSSVSSYRRQLQYSYGSSSSSSSASYSAASSSVTPSYSSPTTSSSSIAASSTSSASSSSGYSSSGGTAVINYISSGYDAAAAAATTTTT
ncbi:unnamed protein product, partial [Amoebophrya sp. A120]